MKIVLKTLTISILALSAFFANAQTLKVPVQSPLQTLKQAFGIGEITIEYSRPSVKGRVIFGDVVPFGKVWRTGANAATKFTFSENVTLDGKPVTAGTYAIYTIPSKEMWEIIVYKDLTLGGNVNDMKAENELFRFKAQPTALPYKVETMTFDVANITPKTANIELKWENTSVSISVTTEYDDQVMKSIETSLAEDKRPYFQAATYYYDNAKDLNKALGFVNKAIEINPKAFFMVHLKAKILMKLKDYKGAIATAEQSLVLAKEAKNNDFIALNEKLIADAKKGK